MKDNISFVNSDLIKSAAINAAINLYLDSNNKQNKNYKFEIIQQNYNKILDIMDPYLQDKIRNENNKDLSKETIFDDYIICLEDGVKLKTLKRHLKAHYNLTLSQYKQKWNLPSDYPSVCSSYAKLRQHIAEETAESRTQKMKDKKYGKTA